MTQSKLGADEKMELYLEEQIKQLQVIAIQTEEKLSVMRSMLSVLKTFRTESSRD